MTDQQKFEFRTSEKGVIAAGGPETAAAGAEMLRQGGNAVDAAVAAAFASFIAEIGVVHLGGSGMAQVYDAQNEQGVVYDFFSNTPGLGKSPNGSRSMDFSEVTIDFGATTQNFHLGRAAVAVPGNIPGLCQMAADFGRFPLTTLLQPAIKLAEEGVTMQPFQAYTCDLLTPLYTHTAGMREIFTTSGQMVQPHERLFLPDLADTYRELAQTGGDLQRNGRLAQALIADQKANGGLLTAQDLANYQVRKQSPVRLIYRGYTILLPPPSSTGGVLTAFTLKLLAQFEVNGTPHGSMAHLRLLFEAMAATSRARPFWDKAIEEMHRDKAVARFLRDEFVEQYVCEMRDALNSSGPSSTPNEPKGPSNTSHLSVIDGDGMTVSLTTTAGESAGYVVPGTGFIPNNIMGEEDLHPHGFHSRPPGQRIPTMMTPTIVLCQTQPRLVIGSGGSIRIRSAIMQVLSNLLDFHLHLDEAVNSARVHLEDGVLQCEAGFDADAVDELEALGYSVNRWEERSIYFGGAHSVSRTQGGRLFAAGDTRRGGAVAAA